MPAMQPNPFYESKTQGPYMGTAAPNGGFANPTGNALVDAAGWDLDTIRKGGEQADDYLRTGYGNAVGSLNQVAGMYDPILQRATKGANLYADSLGVNGAGGNTRATDAFQAGPGYQFGVDQAVQGATRAASAGGMLASGNTLAAVTDRAHGLADQEYGGWQDRLSGYNGLEMGAAQGKAGALGSIADMAYGYGSDRAGVQAGISQGEMGAYNQYGTALEDEKAAQKAQEAQDKKNKMDMIGSIIGLIGKGVGFLGGLSDPRAKKNIRMVGKTYAGLPVYTFVYRDDPDNEIRMGVMADEVQTVFPDAVHKGHDGLLRVDYGAIR